MPSNSINVDEIINVLINFNASLLDQMIGVMDKMESDLLSLSDPSILQGEVEEILRQILQIAQNSIETVMSLQEQLQTRIVESYFPAQD